MRLADRALATLQRMLPAEEASAHCDIPCGIYDPHAAQIAAHTVVRMMMLLKDLPKPADGASNDERDQYVAQVSRYVRTKEEHAAMCEHELMILWTDYFKPEHLDKYPNLHDIFWKTAKLTSTVKQQSLNMDAAQQLLAGCQQVAEIFWATKGVQTRRQPSNQTSGGEIVYPAA
jgi:nickel superoxide dismutase